MGNKERKKYAFSVQKCAMVNKERKKYAFSVQKCATYSFFNRAESKIYTPTPVSCIKVYNSKEAIMNPPLEGREAENMRSLCIPISLGSAMVPHIAKNEKKNFETSAPG